MTHPIYEINGKEMVQMVSTTKSGLFKFKDVENGEVYLFEKHELPIDVALKIIYLK